MYSTPNQWFASARQFLVNYRIVLSQSPAHREQPVRINSITYEIFGVANVLMY